MSCTSIFSECSWNQKTFNCCDEFGLVQSSVGFCYMLNSVHARLPRSSVKFIVDRVSKQIYLSVNFTKQFYNWHRNPDVKVSEYLCKYTPEQKSLPTQSQIYPYFKVSYFRTKINWTNENWSIKLLFHWNDNLYFWSQLCIIWGVIFNKATGARKPVKVLSASWYHSQKLKIEIRKNQKHGFIAREKWMLVSSYSFFITLQIFE